MAIDERVLEGFQPIATEEGQPGQPPQTHRHLFTYSLALGSAVALVVGFWCYFFFHFLLSDPSARISSPTEPARHYLWGQELLPYEFLALSVVPALVTFVVATLVNLCWDYAKA